MIGTTSGTGSEVTPFSVITASNGRKTSVGASCLYAKASFCDPRYTYTLPEGETVATALDAFSHAIESYFSKNANDTSRMFATQAIQMLYPALSAIKRFGFSTVDRFLRADLQQAAIYAGFAINQTGTCFPHPLGYFLTENYEVPHGLACAIFLPAFLQWAYEKAAEEETESLLKELNMENFDPIIEVLRYYTQLDLSISREEMNLLINRVQNAKGVVLSPGKVTKADLEVFLSCIG